jgi:hypothetical protein
MHLIGRFVFQGSMRSLMVVDAHRLFDDLDGLFKVSRMLDTAQNRVAPRI